MDAKKRRGNRMNPIRKKEHVKMEPIVAMKVCGPISLGDQNIVSKCLKAVKFFKEQYTGQKLQKELRGHLYKDIERLLIARKSEKEREYLRKMRHLNAEMNKVAPQVRRRPHSAPF